VKVELTYSLVLIEGVRWNEYSLFNRDSIMPTARRDNKPPLFERIRKSSLTLTEKVK
jgi:hypothetical protein